MSTKVSMARPTQPLTLPGTDRIEWDFSPRAILDAIEILGIIEPVEIKLSQGIRKAGCDRYRGFHAITISRYSTAAEASRTVWHELTHAAQREALGDAFDRAYVAETARHGGGRYGYRANRFEVEARANEALHEDLELTR